MKFLHKKWLTNNKKYNIIYMLKRFRERNYENTKKIIDKFKNKEYNKEKEKVDIEETKGEKQMAKLFSDKAQAILTYMQGNLGADMTAKDIAAATDIETKSITGSINALVKKGFVVREEVEGFDGKLIRLTAEGSTVDPQAEKPE